MKRYLSFSSLSILMLCLLFVECIPEDIALPYRIQSVTTSNATDITARKATLSGEVSLVDTDTITCGIIYGETSDLSAFKGTKVTTTAKDSFAISLSNLKADTEYYYCAYAVDAGRYKLGKVNSFRTNLYASTGMVTEVKAHRATLCGEVIDAMEELSCGFVYGTSSDLTVERGTRVSTTSLGKYSFTVKELKGSTTYYYRAYVVVDGEYKYGEVRSFTTSAYSAEAVDLGLTVKWASCNVGADAPEEFGGLYAWGETEEKDYYYWDSYKWGTSYDYMEKYFVGKHPDGRPVDADNKTVLEPQDDVAHVIWGDKWYMPTLDEVNELLGACTAEWTIVNGVSGQKLTGPNGNSIFFPAAGFRNDFYDTSNILECRYWSSSLRVGSFCNYAHCLLLNDTISYQTTEGRCMGLSVRPVWRDRKDNIAVIPGDVTNISTSGATLSGVVCNTNRELICGFIYGITYELSAASGTMISTTSKGEYILELTKLNENTTYYYRAYVIVDGEYRLGEIRSFMTKSDASATTGEATKITHSSVTLGGTVNNSKEKLTCGIIYGTSSGLTAVRGTKVSTTSNGNYTVNITNLKANTTYYYRAYVNVGGGDRLGDTRSFKTSDVPSVTTGEATNITQTSVTLGGTVNNSQDKLTCGIIYGTSSTLSATLGTKVSTTSNAAYTFNISSLQDNTTYYYCAYVVVDGEYVLGSTRSFKTIVAPSVTTGEATNITRTSVTLGGTVNNSQKKLTCGIIYSTSSTLSATLGTKVSTTSNGAYIVNVSNLQASTTYYYCAYVIVGGQYKLGNTRSFTTKDEVSVTTGEATNITSISACLNGTINKADEPVYTEFCYGTSSSILSDTIFAGKSDGIFSATLNDLQPSTTYYYRALAKVDGEYRYGDVRSFTTEAKVSEPVDASKTYTVNGVSFTMIGVEGGTFTMGSLDSDSEAYSSEKPAHQVTLSSYYIGETEVTQALWQAVMGSNPSYFTSDLQRPVENVSWDNCQTFISKLNELTGESFRLPTEAEWEYAARGGNVSKSYKYSGSNTIGDVAWYSDNYNNYTTHVVKTKQPNELGIYDMSGNVWEWCSDWYGSYSSSAQTNPTGPSSGSFRVLRGGGWSSSAGGCRVAHRVSSGTPNTRSNRDGLRLVRQFIP